MIKAIHGTESSIARVQAAIRKQPARSDHMTPMDTAKYPEPIPRSKPIVEDADMLVASDLLEENGFSEVARFLRTQVGARMK